MLTWAKSIKLSSFCKDTLRELNSFCKFLNVDFWQISSLNRCNWQSLYVDEYLRWLFAEQKFRKFGITLLSHLHNNWRSDSALLILLTSAQFTSAQFTSFRQYNKNPRQNLSKEELTALTNLSKNKDIVIQKSGKGNSVVIVDKDTYIKRMENLLSDQRKFEKVTLKNDAFLNSVVNQ